MSGAGIVHLCLVPGCGAWGAFGEGASLRRGVIGRWWCFAHWPGAVAVERPAVAPAVPIGAPPVDAAAPQGVLL